MTDTANFATDVMNQFTNKWMPPATLFAYTLFANHPYTKNLKEFNEPYNEDIDYIDVIIADVQKSSGSHNVNINIVLAIIADYSLASVILNKAHKVIGGMSPELNPYRGFYTKQAMNKLAKLQDILFSFKLLPYLGNETNTILFSCLLRLALFRISYINLPTGTLFFQIENRIPTVSIESKIHIVAEDKYVDGPKARSYKLLIAEIFDNCYNIDTLDEGTVNKNLHILKCQRMLLAGLKNALLTHSIELTIDQQEQYFLLSHVLPKVLPDPDGITFLIEELHTAMKEIAIK